MQAIIARLNEIVDDERADEEWEGLQAKFEAASAKVNELVAASTAVDEAAAEVQAEAQAARERIADEARAERRRSEAKERQASWESELQSRLEKIDLEAKQRQERQKEQELELLERRARLDAAFAASEELLDRLERRETRRWLESHARVVWGPRSANKENVNAAPKVFSLVGKSAAEVGAMASQVSQITTSAEERIALNKLARAAL